MTIRKYVRLGKAGKSPTKEGRPKAMPETVVEKLIEFEAMLRSFNVPVYRGLVMGHFMQLVEGTTYGDSFMNATGWDWHKLNNFYDRRFMGDHPDVTSGKQRPLDIARALWEKAAAVKPHYDDAASALLKVS